MSWGNLAETLAEMATRSDRAALAAAVLSALEERVPATTAVYAPVGGARAPHLARAPLSTIAKLGVARASDLTADLSARPWLLRLERLSIRDVLVALVHPPGTAPRVLALARRSALFTEEERDRVGYLLPFLWLAEQHARPAIGELPLTGAQRRIVEELQYGMTNVQIAHALGLSACTVRNQLSAIYERCEVANRTELVSRLAAGGPTTRS